MKLQVDDISFGISGKQIIHDIQLRVQTGAFVGLIGPNGSGKSTLLRCIYRSLQPDTGSIILNERDLLTMQPRDIAQEMAVVLQESPVQFDFTVREIVLNGTHPA